MGLLDALPNSAADYAAAVNTAATMMAEHFAREPGPPQAEAIRAKLMAGARPADLLPLERRHWDAMLANAGQLLQMGETEKARKWLTFIYVMGPLDERTLYMLGLACQRSGDLKAAATLYLQFQALDATNPEGLLRLGECLLANGERAEAREAFEMADALCTRGHGTPEARAHARRMLEATRPQAS